MPVRRSPMAPPLPAGFSFGPVPGGPCPSRSAWIPYTQLGEAGRLASVFNEAMEKVTKIGVEPELPSSGPAGHGMARGGLSPSPSSRLDRGVGAAKVDACDPGRVKGVKPATEAGPTLLPVLDGQPGTRFDALVNSP